MNTLELIEDLFGRLDEFDNQRENDYHHIKYEFEELKKQLDVKDVELERFVGERHERAKEKGEAKKAIEDLSQKLEAKDTELQTVVEELSRQLEAKDRELQNVVEELSNQLGEKDTELQTVVGERDSLAQDKDEAQQMVEVLNQQLHQVLMSLSKKETEAKVASEEADLARLQLQQVQEQLEYYFLIDRKRSKILASSELHNKKITDLLISLKSKRMP